MALKNHRQLEAEATPQVSVVVPCRNEARTIGGLLEAINRQTYPADKLEILVIDGLSADGTRQAVQDFARANPKLSIRLIDNPHRTIPGALNLGIAASRAPTIIRLDAHSEPAIDYLECCLAALKASGAANVGGAWDIRPSGCGWMARAIAAAAAHPLGAGDARYRIQGEAGAVDTVPFGAFQRHWLDKVGPFNEELLTNEDYEYNVRLREAGGRVWFDPKIRAVYYARRSLGELLRQYGRYGYWKARMLLHHPRSLRWRQGLPPLFALSLAGWVILYLSLHSRILLDLLVLEVGLYLAVTLTAGWQSAVRDGDALRAIGLPLSLWTMHLAWGFAFLWGLIVPPMSRQNDRPK
jgi:succinoglycan biosynthesis protein ExoA